MPFSPKPIVNGAYDLYEILERYTILISELQRLRDKRTKTRITNE